MALHSLERVAVIGLIVALALLAADGSRYYGRRFLWRLPYARLAHGHIAFLTALIHVRPALVIGLVVLWCALLLALGTTVVRLVHLLADQER